jgi:hypothetical protein
MEEPSLYTNHIELNSLIPGTIYKINTSKSSFLGKYQGKNKNNNLHFIDNATNRIAVLDPTNHIVGVYSRE